MASHIDMSYFAMQHLPIVTSSGMSFMHCRRRALHCIGAACDVYRFAALRLTSGCEKLEELQVEVSNEHEIVIYFRTSMCYVLSPRSSISLKVPLSLSI